MCISVHEHALTNLLAVLSAALSMGLPDGVFEFLMRSLTRAAYGV